MNKMKCVFFLFAICVSLQFGYGQVVGGVNLAEKPEVKYLQVSIGKTINTKRKAYDYIVGVDYGQSQTPESTGLLSATGAPIVFQSDMEPINYLSGFGWRVVSVYRSVLPGGLDMTQIMMERIEKQ